MSNIILPAGSNRNKVEYLAKQMQAQGLTLAQINIAIYGDGTPENKGILAELENSGGGAQTLDIFGGVVGKNLLMNPDFSAPATGFFWDENDENCEEWLWNGGTPAGGKGELFIHGNQAATMMPHLVGWGTEVQPYSDKSALSIHYNDDPQIGLTMDTNNDAFKMAGFPLYISTFMPSDIKLIMFSAFDAPAIAETPMVFASEDMWDDNFDVKKNKYSVYFCYKNYEIKRYGIVKLDRNGDFVEWVAQKDVSALFDGYVAMIEDWLHGVELAAGGRYAFVVESDSANGMNAAMPLAAGVFLNNDELDVRPPQSEQRFYTSPTITGEVGTFSEAGGQFALPQPLPCPFGVEKHFLFGAVKDGSWGAINNQTLHNRSVTYDGQVFNVSGDIEYSGHTETRIRYFYTPTPTHINFYRNGG